jgi:hypothetical protein
MRQLIKIIGGQLMFRKMRRVKNEMSREEAVELLEKCSNGVVSVIGDEGYPYGVPVSYVYLNDKIYFHGATTGHKLDAITANPKVSFTVVYKDDVQPSKFATKYESTIVFGKAHIASDEEKMAGLELILQKYSKDFIPEGKDYIKSDWNNTTAVVIDIEHMTGKRGGLGL